MLNKKMHLLITTYLLAFFIAFNFFVLSGEILAATYLVSASSAGVQGNDNNSLPSISADGRFVAFQSRADNLVSDDSNGQEDIFVHDHQTGETIRVSVSSAGVQGNGGSSYSSISADGRFVAFHSSADNLVSDDSNGRIDIFVHDRQTGETIRGSVNSAGVQGNNGSSNPSISADGRFVAFHSSADNLVSDDSNGVYEVFVHDRQTGETTRMNINSAGVQGNSYSRYSSISADGRFVAFHSYANNLVSDDSNGVCDVFVHDRQTGETTRVSVSSAGVQGNSHSFSDHLAISADGRFVAFVSFANNLVSDDSNGERDVFVHDRQTSETTIVNVSSAGVQGNDDSSYPSISADGRFVAFQSFADNLVSDDPNHLDVFAHDRQSGETTLVSVNSAGVQGNNGSSNPSISADGRFVAFQSSADNLVSDDSNYLDVFVHDRGLQIAPIIAQAPMSGPPGTTFTQWGTGFTPGSTVTLNFRNHLGEELPSLQIDTNDIGRFEYVYNSPSDKPEGIHTWWAVDSASGSRSRILGYEITGNDGVTTQIDEWQEPEVLPLPIIPTDFGDLVRVGEWNELLDIFVIVHGWNRDNLENVPGWVEPLCNDIISATTDPDSAPTGANVFYWDWHDKAKSNGPVEEILTFDKCIDFPNVPFDMTRKSGEYLAEALKEIVPDPYGGNIHLIGHSLGSLVITYAAKYASDDKWPLHYKDNIDHLVFFDSPCHIGRPGDEFLRTNDDIFLENYWSWLGKIYGYAEADTNIYLTKSMSFSGLLTVKDPHAYSNLWYRSSVTNFDRADLLGDPSEPEEILPYGFYWWNESNRQDVKPFYEQKLYSYHWQLYSGSLAEIPGAILDRAQYSGEIYAQTWLKLNDFAERSQKKATLLAVNTYNTVSDTAGYLTDQLGHAFHEAFSCEGSVCGALRMEHRSTSVVTTLVDIPAEANALTFGYKFYYAPPGSILEVFLDNLTIYSSLSHQDIYEGYRLARFIDISQYSGNPVRLTFRISNPIPETEGAVMIDDLIFMKIQNQYPGDCNEDVDVDGIDLADFISAFISNRILGPCNADYNHDGNVDSMDLRIFVRSFGMKD